MDDARQIEFLRHTLAGLQEQWRWTPKTKTFTSERAVLRSEFKRIFKLFQDCGLGGPHQQANTPPEKRDPFSIWHTHDQHIRFPAGMSARQAVETLTNGQCGD